MRAFTYARAASTADAVVGKARIIAGGTNLLDLMKLDIKTPAHVLDINQIGQDQIKADGKGLLIGTLVTNADCAADDKVRRDWPLLSQAILAGASPQIRNKATTGGNLCQRTRCGYFYDPASACNKRVPNSGCDALQGVNRNHAILGTSEACIATYPGDMAVALVALEAVVTIEGPGGRRRVAMSEFHRLPGDDASRDNVLAAGDVITAVTLPAPLGGRHIYRKVRDRSSYAFALVSVACVVVMDGDRIGRARLAFGGVAHKPWRDTEAEKLLEGARPSPALFNRAADAILKDAQGFGANDFKILLVRRTLCAVLNEATKG